MFSINLKTFLIALLASTTCLSCFAQSNDSTKVRRLLKVALNRVYANPDTSVQLISEALEISEAIKQDYLIGLSYNHLGIYYDVTSKYDEAIEAYNQAIEYAKKADNNSLVMSATNNIGLVLMNQSRLSEAQAKFIEAARLFEQEEKWKQWANANTNIGLIYKEFGQYKKATKCELKSLETRERIKDTFGISASLVNLGNIYADLKNDSALLFAKRAIPFCTASNNLWGLGMALHNTAAYLNAREQYDSALVYINKVLELQESGSRNGRYLAGDYVLRGEILFYLGKPLQAKPDIQKGIELHEKTSINNRLYRAYRLMAEVCKANGEYELAYDIWEKYATLGDTLIAQNNSDKFLEMATKYETEKKNREIAEQAVEITKSERRIYWFWGGIALLTLVSLFILNLAIQRKRKNDLLREQAEELKKIDNLKEQFFTNISHELRTPLTLVTTPLEKLLNSDTKQPEDLKIAYSNSLKLKSIVNDILDLSKLEDDSLVINNSTFRLYPFIIKLLESFKPLTEFRRLNMRLDFEVDKATCINCDANKLERILTNLIANAVKFSSEKGQILVLVAIRKDNLVFTISDTGKGIDPRDLPYIFDRYYQSKHTDVDGGTGIGLALCKKLVAKLKGEITVDSQIDKGSSFTLELDQSCVAVHSKTPATTEIEEDISSSNKSVLIVEDNQEMANFIKSLLDESHDVHLSRNGKNALENLSSKTYDLILTDVMMPEMGGFELVKHIRNTDVHYDTPIIYLTAKRFNPAQMRLLTPGLDDYLQKPFNINELMARINSLTTNKAERDKSTGEDGSSKEIYEKDLFVKAENIVLNQLSNPKYTVKEFASDMAYSERQINRILKKITGLSTLNFIREIRLRQAMILLENGVHKSVKDTSRAVGFESDSYFTKQFNKRFGQNPSELLKRQKTVD